MKKKGKELGDKGELCSLPFTERGNLRCLEDFNVIKERNDIRFF